MFPLLIPELGAKLDKKFANFTKIPKFLIINIKVKVNVIRYLLLHQCDYVNILAFLLVSICLLTPVPYNA